MQLNVVWPALVKWSLTTTVLRLKEIRYFSIVARDTLKTLAYHSLPNSKHANVFKNAKRSYDKGSSWCSTVMVLILNYIPTVAILDPPSWGWSFPAQNRGDPLSYNIYGFWTTFPCLYHFDDDHVEHANSILYFWPRNEKYPQKLGDTAGYGVKQTELRLFYLCSQW